MQGDGTRCCTLRNVACFAGCLACNVAFSALSSVAATQDHCFGVGLFLEDGCGSGNLVVGVGHRRLLNRVGLLGQSWVSTNKCFQFHLLLCSSHFCSIKTTLPALKISDLHQCF